MEQRKKIILYKSIDNSLKLINKKNNKNNLKI